MSIRKMSGAQAIEKLSGDETTLADVKEAVIYCIDVIIKARQDCNNLANEVSIVADRVEDASSKGHGQLGEHREILDDHGRRLSGHDAELAKLNSNIDAIHNTMSAINLSMTHMQESVRSQEKNAHLIFEMLRDQIKLKPSSAPKSAPQKPHWLSKVPLPAWGIVTAVTIGSLIYLATGDDSILKMFGGAK